MAHRAGLVFSGLVMRRSGGPLNRERVALQAEQVHLAHAQVAWIGGPVGRVTTATALGLHRHMLIHKWPLFVGMALDANRVAAGHRPYLPERSGAVDVVAVAALNETFVDAMVIRLREVGLGRHMASVAEFGLC